MKTFPWLSASPYALALLGVGLWQSGAWAQPGERDSLPLVKAPVVQDVAPLGVKGTQEVAPLGVKGADGGGVGQVGAAQLEVSVSAYKVAAALKKLRAREMTPQQAWDSKALDVDDLIYFLEKGLDSWGGFFYEKDPELRRALVALLVEHGNERLKKPEDLSLRVRLWLADYYGNDEDDRVLALAESILAEIKEPAKSEDPLTFQAIERIAWFYRDQGQWEKGARTWLRVQTYNIGVGWWQPDALVEAARLYSRAGRSDRALQLYSQVPKFGYGWATGMARLEQATDLINKGNLKEARQLLLSPAYGMNSVQIEPILLSLLGNVEFMDGNLIASKNYFDVAIKKYSKALSDGLIDTSDELNIQDYMESTECDLEDVKAWLMNPIRRETRSINVNLKRKSKGTVIMRLRLHTPRGMKFSVSTDNSLLRAYIVDLSHRIGTNQNYEKELVVKLNSDAIKKKTVIHATISSGSLKGYVMNVPIIIEPEK